MSRALGVDLGKARIGLAAMDLEAGLPRPLPTLQAIGTLSKDATLVVAVARKEEATVIVLGLPLMDGEETPQSKVVRRFGALLEDQGFAVRYADESLSTHEAEDHLFDSGLSAATRKKMRDSEAACVILQRFHLQEKA